MTLRKENAGSSKHNCGGPAIRQKNETSDEKKRQAGPDNQKNRGDLSSSVVISSFLKMKGMWYRYKRKGVGVGHSENCQQKANFRTLMKVISRRKNAGGGGKNASFQENRGAAKRNYPYDWFKRDGLLRSRPREREESVCKFYEIEVLAGLKGEKKNQWKKKRGMRSRRLRRQRWGSPSTLKLNRTELNQP